MCETESSSIHTFWVGPYTKYGCSDCKRAAWSADGITHTDACSMEV